MPPVAAVPTSKLLLLVALGDVAERLRAQGRAKGADAGGVQLRADAREADFHAAQGDGRGGGGDDGGCGRGRGGAGGGTG
ncbi:hypothetical protein GCM10010844_28700 [Deinococcus radiotolerans]|uniref:Uncharacterized protein n=1 Tax=Deinococcus radiotolerans TaxID=1309407 RepID=A0ABQ2FM55_9DEIO|nr:hypothetical protein GCM10010844_28700 [Deinococcus radiotolerans]